MINKDSTNLEHGQRWHKITQDLAGKTGKTQPLARIGWGKTVRSPDAALDW